MSSTRAPRVAPLPSTVLLPPVWVRRIVGIRTSMAMVLVSPRALGCWGRVRTRGTYDYERQRRRATGDSAGGAVSCGSVVDDSGRRVAEQVGLDDLDVLL